MFETLLGRSPSAIDYDRDQTVGLWGQLVKGVQGVRLAVLDDTERRWADQAMLDLYDKSLDLLSNLGAHIEVVRLPIGFDDLKGASGTIMSAEGYYHHGPWYEEQIDCAIAQFGHGFWPEKRSAHSRTSMPCNSAFKIK